MDPSGSAAVHQPCRWPVRGRRSSSVGSSLCCSRSAAIRRYGLCFPGTRSAYENSWESNHHSACFSKPALVHSACCQPDDSRSDFEMEPLGLHATGQLLPWRVTWSRLSLVLVYCLSRRADRLPQLLWCGTRPHAHDRGGIVGDSPQLNTASREGRRCRPKTLSDRPRRLETLACAVPPIFSLYW